jgi:hypothetical protein
MVKKIIRSDSHVTGMEQKMREEATRKTALELAQEYMSDSLAIEFTQKLREMVFYYYMARISEKV